MTTDTDIKSILQNIYHKVGRGGSIWVRIAKSSESRGPIWRQKTLVGLPTWTYDYERAQKLADQNFQRQGRSTVAELVLVLKRLDQMAVVREQDEKLVVVRFGSLVQSKLADTGVVEERITQYDKDHIKFGQSYGLETVVQEMTEVALTDPRRRRPGPPGKKH